MNFYVSLRWHFVILTDLDEFVDFPLSAAAPMLADPAVPMPTIRGTSVGVDVALWDQWRCPRCFQTQLPL